METSTRIWTIAASVVAFTLVSTCGAAFLFWKRLPSEEQVFLFLFFKEHFVYFFSFSFLLLIGLGLLLDGIIHIYVLPIKKLIEETTLISSVNPAHRIAPDGSPDVRLLADVLNNWADQHQRLKKSIAQEIRKSKAEVEREKNILAALVTDFREGVLVCNTQGAILLYNRKAVRLFSRSASADEVPPIVDGSLARENTPSDTRDDAIGLGRSIFRVIDEDLIVHALDEIQDKLQRQSSNAVAFFVTVTQAETLLRVEMTPVLNQERELTGMILVLDDISVKLEQDQRVALLVRALLNGLRASLGSIRSAIETIIAYPEIPPEQRDRFQSIIHEESIGLGALAEKVSDEYSLRNATQWPRVAMRVDDLIEAVCHRAKALLDVRIRPEAPREETSRWVKVDSYSILLAILFFVERLREITGGAALSIRPGQQNRFTVIDLIWTGAPIRIEILRRWEGERLKVGSSGVSLTLGEVIGHHEADIWSSESRTQPDVAYLRLFLPTSGKSIDADVARDITILTEENAPGFYDFDLFHQTGLTIELGKRPLSELAITVFDTETTGLDPRGGDEIISLAAVRIVNGRLLYKERFDQLIDPQRHLSAASIQIHGILPEMLTGQPTIETVLPRFHRFCEDTVLVAHNAAFDMLLFQLKEAPTGVTFTHPILDTLLLSHGLHPAHRTHELEKIAGRLGIEVVGRHTAIGDALTTAEILLRMLPLLSRKGVHTLNDAIEFSKRSHYARLKY